MVPRRHPLFSGVGLLLMRMGMVVIAVGVFAHQAKAAQVTAILDVQAEIVPGCEIGASVPMNMQSVGNIGEINFGSHFALIKQDVSSALLQTTAFRIHCTPSVGISMQIDGGLHSASNRRMVSQSGTEKLDYQLFSDAGLTTEIKPNEPIPVTFTDAFSINLPVYARLEISGKQVPGAYADRLVVTLAW